MRNGLSPVLNEAGPGYNELAHTMSRRRSEAEEPDFSDQPIPAYTGPDTRSLAGQLCGDPLPGRSALDRERARGKCS